jgi:hypothetical protein
MRSPEVWEHPRCPQLQPPLQLKPNGTISYVTNYFILFSKLTTPVEVDDE